jgi:F-type H+-transporting ATPase subunit delta
MKNTRVARRYATALMHVAEHGKDIDAVAKDLEVVAQTATSSRDFKLLLASPVISPSRKRSIFSELFGKRFCKETMAFLNLLTTKSREGVLPEIIEQFRRLHDERAGITNVDVRTVLEFNYAQEKELKAGLERMVGGKVRLRFRVDPGIKGGIVVKVGDTVLDASVTRQLARMHERFVAGQAA